MGESALSMRGVWQKGVASSSFRPSIICRAREEGSGDGAWQVAKTEEEKCQPGGGDLSGV
jgi:hypothetical protein